MTVDLTKQTDKEGSSVHLEAGQKQKQTSLVLFGEKNRREEP